MTITTDQYNSNLSDRSGFTLVELMITMGILGMIIAVGLSAVTFITQSSSSLGNYTSMSSSSRHALERVARDLRMGYDVNEATLTKLDFEVYGKAGTNQNVVYNYVSADQILYRTVDLGTTEVFLENLTNFQFNYFDLRRDPTTAPISVKEVQMEGIMQKYSLVLTNTNYVISARFMMRNRSVSD